MIEYEPVIGMEVHAELLTESKMFCGCRNAFGGEPNTRCCPVCMGLPGSLPVMNKRAVDLVIRAAIALNCTVNEDSRFDRKNYFYPDLPKGYQISQYDRPIGINGWLDVDVNGTVTRVHIRRVHLEEDTGKLFHANSSDSLVDYNRSGVPLMEIVTEFPPDMHSADEAREYITRLRGILTYIDVSDGKMEEGSLRCEPNVSVRLKGSPTFGTKTEIKNLNSFRAVHKGIDYEVKRQIELIQSDESVVQETRGWHEDSGRTFSQRSKEVEQEYRYFPEPDLVPVRITGDWIEEIRKSMPELPEAARKRLVEEYGLPEYDAGVLTLTRASAVYFEKTAQLSGDPKSTSNWMMGEMARLQNVHGQEIADSRVTPENLAKLIGLIASGAVSGTMAKGMFEEMFLTGTDAAVLADREGRQVSDSAELTELINRVISENGDVYSALVSGDEKKFGFLVGQVMKASMGKANPQAVNQLLRQRMESEKGYNP